MLGEAKHTRAKRTLSDLARLEHVRSVVIGKHPTAVDARLLLLAPGGFDSSLVRAAAGRPDVELIDVERLYSGA